MPVMACLKKMCTEVENTSFNFTHMFSVSGFIADNITSMGVKPCAQVWKAAISLKLALGWYRMKPFGWYGMQPSPGPVIMVNSYRLLACSCSWLAG